MPSGIDAALHSMKLGSVPEQVKVSYNGFEKEAKKKPTVTEPTIDWAAAGLERCRKRMAEQEFKIRKLQEKLAGLPTTKKNKPEISATRDQVEVLQADGDYRAAMDVVRKHEEHERDMRREERERQEEEAMAAGGGKLGKRGSGSVATTPAQPKKQEAAPEASAVETTAFECDAEVVAVVQSALDGSEDAVGKLKAGAGAGTYTSEVHAEVPSIVFASNERTVAKLKRAPTRENALRTIRALLWCPPAVLPAFPATLMLLDETKLKSEPMGKATDLCTNLAKAGPGAKAVPALVLPVLLAHVGAAAAGKWQVKVATMGLLKEVLRWMNEPGCCPKQLGLAMPKIMTTLRDAVGDARKEVKREAEALLRHLGREMAHTPEVRAMADDIVGSILDSANMEKAAEVLQRLANTTFMNTMDSCSFGLLFPVVSRAMREQSHEAKTKGVQIVGASVDLIVDPELLQPYVAELLPLLKECLMHPSSGIQREASKSFGCLAVGLPTLCEEDIYPYLLDKLESRDTNADVSEVDRRGAAHGLTEVLLARRDLLPSCLYRIVLPRITDGSTDEKKAGGLSLFQFLPHLGTAAFAPHLSRCLPVILGALKEGEEVVTKQAMAAMRVLIDEYGSTFPHLLLPPMQEALFYESAEARDLAMQLFFSFCEKLAEAVKFGQDFLSMDALSVAQRHALLGSIFIARTDENPAVRRIATLLWKEKLQSGQKAKTEILPHLQRSLRELKLSRNTVKMAVANACLKELVGSGEITEDVISSLELPTEQPGQKAPESSEIGSIADTEKLDEVLPPPPPQRGQLLAQRARMELAAANLPGPLREYILEVVVSCCIEARTRAAAEAAVEAELAPLADKRSSEATSSVLNSFGLADVLDRVFEGVADEADVVATQELADDVLVRAENVMLMYGGGNTLLKNTTFELKKGHRYGVVGRNGAGKTTLMSTIAAGGVAQVSATLKTLHVRPEVLVEASELNAVQFCLNDSPQGTSEDALEKALLEVGFPKDMQTKSVNELSGGWRMKLLLASAMMRDCDILLLDEPTNHLDKESVEWLSNYLCSLKRSSLMVISHDPNFLNTVCTDIIHYSAQRTLDYYPGNFAHFLSVRRISSDEEAEALLLGKGDAGESKGALPLEPHPKEANPGEGSIDEPQLDGVGDDDGGTAATTGLSAAVLDKQSKISFPVPGKLQGHSSGKPVMELKNVSFAYNEEEGPMILKDVSCRLYLNCRVGIVGVNGAGKSTLLNLLCGELAPSPGSGGAPLGEVLRHRNLRLAYIAQQHMYHLSGFLDCTPSVYIQQRFKNGWDEALQERLITPQTEDEAKMRRELATRYGKYGNEVDEIVGRHVRGSDLFYEVKWKDLPDQKQNTHESIAKLKMMGVASLAKAYDERLAASNAGIDQRPLTQKEIVKHLEQFGLDEELVLNREIGSFSAGQKSKLTLGAAFWTKPHIVAFDEPTNYIDMQTLDSLAKGLTRFKGGVIVISHSKDFVERVCEETWLVEECTIASRTRKDDKK